MSSSGWITVLSKANNLISVFIEHVCYEITVAVGGHTVANQPPPTKPVMKLWRHSQLRPGRGVEGWTSGRGHGRDRKLHFPDRQLQFYDTADYASSKF